MQIKKQLIKYNKGGVNKPKFIVIHDTANTSKGAGAQNHYRYFNGGDRGASAHYFVDDKEIVQTVEHGVQSWHNGIKYKPIVQLDNPECNNSNSIGVETCVNSDGDYVKAIFNTIWLTKKLMQELNIPLSNVIRHYDSCGKNCPERMIKENKWGWFKQMLKETTERGYEVKKTKISLNGVIKEVDTINIDGNNYIKLRDLSDSKIVVDYDSANKLPIIGLRVQA